MLIHSESGDRRRSEMEEWTDSDLDQLYDILIRLSDVLRYLIPALALVLLVLLFAMNISAAADPVEIYVRNLSSIAALTVLAIFFNRYYHFHTTVIDQYYMRPLKIASLLLFIAGIIKVIISVYYFVFCFASGNFIMFFYVGEILVWLMISLFAICYFQRLRKY